MHITDRIRVLVVARTQILCDGLSAMIRSEPDMELVGTAALPDAAVKAFLASSPDVTLMDLDLPGSRGLTAIRSIRAADPAARIVGLLTDEWDELGRDALVAGVWSCICKDRLTADLPAAIRRSYRNTPLKSGGSS